MKSKMACILLGCMLVFSIAFFSTWGTSAKDSASAKGSAETEALEAVSSITTLTYVQKPTPPSGPTARLYFTDREARYFIEELRPVREMTPEALMEALLQGPRGDGIPSLPPGAKLLGIAVEDKTAYVNFNQAFVDNHWGGSAGEMMTIYSVVHTLTANTELGIVQVVFLVEGDPIDTLAGHLDLSGPITPREGFR